MKIAVVRGKFLNRYEMQFFEPLVKDFDLTAFGSLTPYHDQFAFPVIKLPSPMDLSGGARSRFARPILNRLFTDAHYLLGLEKKLKGFDIVHTAETYFHYTQQCLNAKRKGYVRKVVATVLENIPFNNEGIWGRKAFKKRARKELDHIIALTNKTKAALIMEGCEPSKITVIGHFVDTRRFHPRKHRSMRTFYKKAMTILFVGRLEEYKGVFDFVRMAAQLPRNLRFVMIGDGSERKNLEKLEKEFGVAIQHRSVSYEQMPHAYRDADIFVAPSKPRTVLVRGKPYTTWEEQYSTVLLEAQASGLPIVTTNSGGIPENVGDAAIMVPPGDVGAIATAIKQFVASPTLRRTYGFKARKRAETVHDITIGARRLRDLYEKILF